MPRRPGPPAPVTAAPAARASTGSRRWERVRLLAAALAAVVLAHCGGASADRTPASAPAAPTTAPGPPGAPPASPLPAVATLAPGAGRPFSPTSPLNTPIPPAPRLDPESDRVVDRLASEGRGNANLVEYGVPVWFADAGTPLQRVACVARDEPCQLEAHGVPVPPTAEPNAGSDGAMVVVDTVRRLSFEFWQARREEDGAWTASWGSVNPIDGDGVATSGGSGSGLSRLAGMVWVHEIRHGVIDHALAFSSRYTCARGYRWPAWSTDGKTTSGACIPEGARVQLDPGIDLAALALTDAERAVARALQVYGAFAVDTGDAPMAFLFERASDHVDDDHPGSVYEAAGLDWDYYGMPGIPWDALRLLATADGS